MSAINYIKLAKAAKAAAAECIALARRQDQQCHFTQRGVDVLAIDENGERIEPVLDIIEVKEISGKRLQRIVETQAPAQYHHICVQGGLDAHNSFQDAMQYPDEYEPGVAWWDVNSNDVPDQRAERVPLEVTQAAQRSGPSVGQRIDMWTIKRQHGAA
ncbi:MAG: hypothetical protein OER87_07505 [Gammaproteobacteria bacterium]|nr:hypothetical protein [Gammaproteobacteria bacterium]MDH3535574.1 hypothetical protein [Gammaproteobacteria bacterium]